MQQFCSPFDEAVALRGPPAVFVPDPEGMWRLDADLSRDAWSRLIAVPSPDPAYVLLRDRATGYVSLMYVGARALLQDHPRAEASFFETEALARAAREALGRPYLQAR